MAEQISVNQLKTWTRCKKKYYYDYIKKLRWPSDQSHFQLGKTIHKLFEYQSRKLTFDPMLAETDPGVQKAWRLLMEHPIPHLPILASEWGFNVPIAGQWIHGRIDRVALDGDQVLVLDWKTGTSVPPIPELDWQTVVYLYATVEAHRELGLPSLSPENVRFVYVEVKDEVRAIPIAHTPERHAQYRSRLETTLEQMQREQTYELPAKCPDPFCPYRAICGIDHQESG